MMNNKTKSCFSPHVLMHSLFGFGLAVVLVNLIPSLNMLWLGVLFMGTGFILDVIRKS